MLQGGAEEPRDLRWLSPARVELLGADAPILGGFRFATLSIVPAATLQWLLSVAGGTALAVCWSFPVSDGLANRQDVSLVALWLALALRLRHKRRFWSGAVLALCALKFHLFVCLPLLLYRHAAWRIATGLLTAAGVLVAMLFPLAYSLYPQIGFLAVLSALAWHVRSTRAAAPGAFRAPAARPG